MKKQKKTTSTLKTIVTYILDKSGSMEGARNAAISGFNEYIKGLQKNKGKFFVSLTLFDTQVKKLYTAKALKDVPELDRDTYDPRGMTALYDAVCQTVKDTEKESDKSSEKVANLVVIMTDGEENSSKEYDEGDLSQIIKDLQAKGNWTFVFLGADRDSFVKAQKWGVHQGNMAQWSNSEVGTRQAFNAVAVASANYSATMDSSMLRGQSLQVKTFFKHSDSDVSDDGR